MCPNYLLNLYHNLCKSFQKCTISECFGKNSLLTEDEDDLEEDAEILRFWVPQRSFSTQSVQSLTTSLKYSKRDSVTSASTIAEDDNTFDSTKQRRHSEISRTFLARSHEWPERNYSLTNSKHLLERTNSVGSLKISLYKDVVPNTQTESNVISEEVLSDLETKDDNSPTEDENLTFGWLSFSINFDENIKRLILHLDKAIDLPHRGRKKTYDTLIKINLIQKQTHLNTRSSFTTKEANQCSRKVKNSLSPHFHEDFMFPIEKLKMLNNLILRLSLYDNERQGRHDAIGNIFLPLNYITKSGENKKFQMPFKSQTSLEFKPNGPQMLVSLSYSSTTDRLTVGVLRCRNLLLTNISAFKNLFKGANTKLDTYVKVTLMCAAVKIKSMKTKVVLIGSDCDPIFNQTFNFVAPHGFIDEISVVISVCVRGKLKLDSVIGRVIAGPIAFASNDKLTHWGRMIFGEERVVTEWRNLYQ